MAAAPAASADHRPPVPPAPYGEATIAGIAARVLAR
jgi:hypothetical protein